MKKLVTTMTVVVAMLLAGSAMASEQGGHGHGGHGHGGHGGHGGGSNGGGVSVSAPSVSVEGPSGVNGGTLTITGGQGISAGDREKLMDAVRQCESVRPGLALGNTTVNGGWSFITYDDTVWPYVQRCMKGEGYVAQGADYSNPTNFGSR